jgi:RimJ/RimL family protein N-acetyltransferase
VSEQLFAWGSDGGARRAILQAETKNRAAQALYERLGFRPRYVYRDLVPVA